MLFLHAEDLKRQGIDFQEASQIVFQNLLFTKGQSFSPDRRQAAIAICQKYLKADILCLIVESHDTYTLWRENKHLNLPVEPSVIPASKVTKYQNTFLPSPEKAPSKTVPQKDFRNPSGDRQPAASGFPVKNGKTPAVL